MRVSSVVRHARQLREGAYRILSPFDALIRTVAGDGDLPPLWLRRHAGRVRAFRSAAADAMAIFLHQNLLNPGDLIVDIGCGAGSMALEFERVMSADNRYIGFDVHRPSIEWCRKRFAKDSRFRFELAEITTPYSSNPGSSAEQYRFPAADGSAGLVFAKSVFTHLLEPEVHRYLAEIRRVLSDNRTAAISAFLYRRGSAVPAFPHTGPDDYIRYRLRSHPHAAVAYDREHFEQLASEAGLRVSYVHPGFWPGQDNPPRGQDFVFLAPKS